MFDLSCSHVQFFTIVYLYYIFGSFFPLSYHDICKLRLSTYLTVCLLTEKPQIIDIFTSSNMFKEEGDRVELKCEAEGIPAPLISWVRAGGGILPSGGRELVVSMAGSS